jgi:hypothetical protein
MPHVLFVSPNRDEADMYKLGLQVAGCLIMTVADGASTHTAATEFYSMQQLSLPTSEISRAGGGARQSVRHSRQTLLS